MSGVLPLDDRRVEIGSVSRVILLDSARILERVLGTIDAVHFGRIDAISGETESPKQASPENLAADLAVVLAILDLELILPDGAVTFRGLLRRLPAALTLDIGAADFFAALERVTSFWTALEIETRDRIDPVLASHPDLGAADQVEPLLGRH